MATFLPIDIIVSEIFSKLPIKSILRFKCVSKSFKALISTPEFGELHLRHSLFSSTDHHLVALNGVHKGFYTFDLNSPKNSVINHPYPDCMNACIFFIGSCNGLLCMGNGKHELSFFVMNPYTRIYRSIQFGPTKPYDPMFCKFGFGYDDANDDYKVVASMSSYPRLTVNGEYGEDAFSMSMVVWVYSLRALSWKLIEKKSCQGWYIQGNSALIDNHLVHWKFRDSIQTQIKPDRIRCFDLGSETWAEADVELPKRDMRVVDVGVLDGCLSLVALGELEVFSRGELLSAWTHQSDLWVMKEYGVKESWVKLVSFSNSTLATSIGTCPLTFCQRSSSDSEEEILLNRVGEITLMWFNIRNQTFRNCEIHGIPYDSKVYTFMPSLVFVPGGRPIGPATNQDKSIL